MDEATFSAAESHHRERFNVLASESTGSNHESMDLTKLVLDFLAVNTDLVIVAATAGSSVNGALRQRLKDVVMEHLLDWRVFARKLNDFLGNNTTKECSH